MSDLCDKWTPLDDVERMVQAAGGFVRASDDLRPRVLEGARAQSKKRTIRGTAGLLVISTALVAYVGAGGSSSADAVSDQKPTLRRIDSQTVYSQAQAKALGSGGLSWGIVDVFRELRRKQSEAIRSEL